jgi:hypothetical protein
MGKRYRSDRKLIFAKRTSFGNTVLEETQIFIEKYKEEKSKKF